MGDRTRDTRIKSSLRFVLDYAFVFGACFFVYLTLRHSYLSHRFILSQAARYIGNFVGKLHSCLRIPGLIAIHSRERS